MVRISQLSLTFAVAPQLMVDDFAALAAQGFKSVISNRPDGEVSMQLTAGEAATLAAAVGLQFRHLPLTMADVLEPAAAAATRAAISELPGPVLAFCKSGTRSAIVWAAAAAETEPVESVIAALKNADFEIPGLASELRVRSALQG